MVKPIKEHAMSITPRSPKDLFLAAVEKATPTERAAFLSYADDASGHGPCASVTIGKSYKHCRRDESPQS
jgi:hypothetical protein